MKSREAVSAPELDSDAAAVRYSDCYTEWRYFDDDDGEVTIGPVEIDVVEVTLSSLRARFADDEGSLYDVLLTSIGSKWTGTFTCRDAETRELRGGKCSLAEASPSADHRQFRGRWLELDRNFEWELVLRAPIGANKGRLSTTPRQKLERTALAILETLSNDDLGSGFSERVIALYDSDLTGRWASNSERSEKEEPSKPAKRRR